VSIEKQQTEVAELRTQLEAWLEGNIHVRARRQVNRFMLCITAAHRLKTSSSDVEARLADSPIGEVVDRLVLEDAMLAPSRHARASPLHEWLAEQDVDRLPLGQRYFRALVDAEPTVWDVVDFRAGEWIDLRPYGTKKPVIRGNATPAIGVLEPGIRLLARVVPMPSGVEFGSSLLKLSPDIPLRRSATASDLVDDVFARWAAHHLGARSSNKTKSGETELERVKERVRKLYAMSQQTEASPHEAEIALRRCSSLMVKFGITEADLETSAFGTAASPRRTVAMHVRYLGSAVAALHDVLFVTGGLDGVEFRGYEIDVGVARLTFEYLEDAVERALLARRRAGGFPAGRAAAYDYRIGFASEVSTRVQAMVTERKQAERAASPTGMALSVRKREIVDRECGADLGIARSIHRGTRDEAAAAAGRADGSQVSLDPQVGQESASKRLGRD